MNRDKVQRVAARQPACTDAVRVHLGTAYVLSKPRVSSVHAARHLATKGVGSSGVGTVTAPLHGGSVVEA